jgi:hypothetical protein
MAKKRRRAPVASDKRFKRVPADGGPPERWQHSGRTIEYTDQAGIFVARASEEHMLDTLLLLRVITEREREAGLKLCDDYVQAKIEERVTASYNSVRTQRSDAESRITRNEMQEAAYTRWRKALAGVEARAQNALIHVCCCGHPPNTAQFAFFKLGLDRLCAYYGIR